MNLPTTKTKTVLRAFFKSLISTQKKFKPDLYHVEHRRGRSATNQPLSIKYTEKMVLTVYKNISVHIGSLECVVPS